MSLKNDALILSYSMFHFFSDQVRNGVIPWWHHNLHLGFPLHADPGFPFWSPLTWIAALTGSSLYVYTGLVMSYLAIAGIGMIKLTQWLRFGFSAQLLVALGYVLSGFFVAHLQHPHHIFEAAFIPFCVLFFLRLIFAPGLRNSLLLAVSLFFLVNSGYPSFPISTAYFFTLLLGTLLLSNKSIRSGSHLRPLMSWLGIALIISGILCLPYLVSVYELEPLYNRGGSQIREQAATGGITVLSLLSLLFPLPGALDPVFFGTNITWNNVYIGLLPLVFAIAGIRSAKHSLKLPLMVAGAGMLLLSMQGPLKALFNKTVPLYNLVYSNGGHRIYFMLALLLIGGWGIQRFRMGYNSVFFRRVVVLLLIVFALVACFTIGSLLPWHAGTPKEFLKNISLQNGFFFQSLIGMTFLMLVLFFRTRQKLILLAGCAELILAFLINLPFTGLGITKASEVRKQLDSIDFAVNQIHPSATLETISREAGWNRFLHQPLLFYHSIGQIGNGSYPSSLYPYKVFLESDRADQINSKRVIFSSSELTVTPVDGTDPAAIQTGGLNAEGGQIGGEHTDEMHTDGKFESLVVNGSGFSFRVPAGRPADTLVVLQNIYPNWKYYVNGVEVQAVRALGTFAAIPVTQGPASISGIYRPSTSVICFWVSIFAWGIVIFKLLKKSSPARNVYRNR